jgi:PiT family inorganic phosphate transporter
MGAITWNLITWWGLASPRPRRMRWWAASSGRGHQGGVFGNCLGGLSKTLYAIVLSPVTGFMLGILLVILADQLAVRARQPGLCGRLLSASCSFSPRRLYSLGHGSNDAQKTAGIIAVLLYSNGYYAEFTVPAG